MSTIRFNTAAACTDGKEVNASSVGGVAGENGVLGEGTGNAAGSSGGGGALFGVETTDGQVFEADAVVLAVGITAAKVGPPLNSTAQRTTPHQIASHQPAHLPKTHTPHLTAETHELSTTPHQNA